MKTCIHKVTLGMSAVVVLGMAGSQPVAAQEITFSLDQPFLDRWNYPFNQTPGTRPTAPVFCAFLETDFFPDLDERDGQFHVGFKTDADVTTGLGPDAYTVTAARVTMMIATNNAFNYSLLIPLWQWYLPPDHPDFICPVDQSPCPPNNTVIPTPAIKLFGVGFRNGFDALTYQENTPYSPFGPFGQGHRTTYALDLDEEGKPRDVSNNVDDGFNPHPFALGMTTEVELGQQVPANTTITFDIDVDDPHIQNYLREGLDLGILHFMVATLHITQQEVGGNIPEFFCKENLLVELGFANASGLELTVVVDEGPEPCAPADLNCSGSVGVPDLLILLANWGPCDDCPPAPGDCPADLTGDCNVGVPDLLFLLANWG